MSDPDDDTYLEVDAEGMVGTGDAVAHILHSVAETLEDAPDDRRYDFDLRVNEHTVDTEDGQ